MSSITINPAKEFKKTPEKFSSESKILSLERSEGTSGIVFDSPEDFGEALKVYGSGRIPKSRVAQNNTLEQISESGGSMAVGIALLGGALGDSDEFSNNLAKRAVYALKTSGRFDESFEYTFNPFEKTSLTGKRIGDKYVLELCAAYVGSQPERNLAEALKRPMALLRSSVKGQISVVDDWWFNFNLEDAIRGLPISKKQIKGLSSYIASNGFRGSEPNIEFNYNRQKLRLSVGLSFDRHLRPEAGDYYVQDRENSIVGGAWTDRDEEYKLIDVQARSPSVFYSVSMPMGERFSSPPAVTEKEMKALHSARDHIFKIIASEHKIK